MKNFADNRIQQKSSKLGDFFCDKFLQKIYHNTTQLRIIVMVFQNNCGIIMPFELLSITMKKSVILGMLLATASVCTSANALLPTPTQNPLTALQVIGTAPPPLLGQQQTATPIQATLTPAVYAFVVQSDELGNEQLMPIQAGIAPKQGDTLEYQIHYTNHTGERIRRAVVAVNVPAGVELIGGVSPLGASASINGSVYGRMPLRGSIGGVVQEIPFKYYKALRWTIEDVGLNGTAVVKYRAILK